MTVKFELRRYFIIPMDPERELMIAMGFDAEKAFRAYEAKVVQDALDRWKKEDLDLVKWIGPGMDSEEG